MHSIDNPAQRLINRTGSNDKLLGNPKLLQAVFSDDVLKNKRNTDAIDVGGNTLVVAHLTDHQPASTRPLTEVSADIEKYLTRQQAAQLSAEQGRNLLERLQHGETIPIDWGPSKPVSHNATQETTDLLLQEAFRMDVSKLPAYGGVESPKGGFMLLKISRVSENNESDSDGKQVETVKGQLQQIAGQRS